MRIASFEPVYLTTPLYVFEIKKVINRTRRVTLQATGKVFKSASGIWAKLNLKKKASVNENAEIITSIINIDQRGMLFFQKKLNS